MVERLKLIKMVIQGVAILFFALQIGTAIQRYLSKPTMTSPGTKSLSKMNNTYMLITVCKINQLDYTLLASFGYNTSRNFLSGKLNHKKILSWSGFQGNLSFNETVHILYNSGLGNIDMDVKRVTNKFLIPHGHCKVYEMKPVNHISIKLKSVAKTSEYFVFVSDPTATNSFQLPYSLMSGDTIRQGFIMFSLIPLAVRSIT